MIYGLIATYILRIVTGAIENQIEPGERYPEFYR